MVVYAMDFPSPLHLCHGLSFSCPLLCIITHGLLICTLFRHTSIIIGVSIIIVVSRYMYACLNCCAPKCQYCLKPIFHRNLPLRRLIFAQPTRKMMHKQHGQRQKTQCHLYSTGNGVRVGYPMWMKSTKKEEMYMANARNVRHLMPEIPTCLYFLRRLMQKIVLLRYLTQKYPTPVVLRRSGI